MFSRQTTITVPVAVEHVYRFLRTRYDSPNVTKAEMDTKGYVPRVRWLEEDENTRLVFSVPARDPILRISFGGWKCEYNLKPVSSSSTQVAIRYTYSVWMAFFGMGTMGHQAANEIAETVSALDALAIPIHSTNA